MAWFGYDQGVFSGVLISAGEKDFQGSDATSFNKNLKLYRFQKALP